MKYNGELDIALGMGARSKTWKNKKLRWSELVARLKTPTVTKETLREYAAASKADKSKIKDLGGYFGGYLNKGRRNPKNVLLRQLVTLDIDYAHLDFWDDFTMSYDNAAVLHTTHSHTDKSPRYRLIMPLSRDVSPDEYLAITRRIAGNLDIELFDDTTFQINRLMFWPSVSADAEYHFNLQDGPFIDADEVLASYVDWTDSTSWPLSSRVRQSARQAAEAQQDPETKKGVIGVFCRAYTITTVIERYLDDVYTPSELEDRYTYIPGSTSGGLVVYEDKFAYSHHGTDPTSGQLCNVFDLVRLHKFTHMAPGEGFKAMQALALEDDLVKKTLAFEKVALAKYDFKEDLPDEIDDDALEWATELEADARGNYLSNARNLNTIFANDTRLLTIFRENSFDRKRYVFKSLPWRKIDGPEPITSVDYSGVRNYIETIYGITGTQKIGDALALEFQKHSFNPIREYLDGLRWDGIERVDSFLVDYFGVEDSAYARQAIRKTLVGAVARIYRPGIKFDLVLTLVGDEGTGKSTFVRKLGGEWTSDTFLTVHGKDAFEQLQGSWIIEIAELAALKKAEVESIKHFISKQVDQYRPPYRETVETYKRQCVFIATTNDYSFLRGTTGNRRFLPVDVNFSRATKDIFKLDKDTVGQIWAEAVELYNAGELLYMVGDALQTAREEQKEHSVHDERQGVIEKYLNTLLPEDWQDLPLERRRTFLHDPLSPKGTVEREYVCVAEIWAECLLKEVKDMDRYKTREINEILRNFPDWLRLKKTKTFKIYGKQKYYEKTIY